MLKALELFGFKSFADKTRFEFPPGITVVVGPNGSGKSNVVDAIKWVLGEQSARSLRGKEMSDVIFKGGGEGNRKLMNAAEATIVFENESRRLPVDAPEVHVTRRVYRSGEGEYLINGNPCRLKDIRDMFRGTGVGTDAYSLIEQGKVDQLLAASSKDRRAIFEEAAGISRFKAKKIETQRRLERVDQNLLRLRDIVDEVENRLKNVRNQASKARRYREYSTRLQELRTQVGLTDWQNLSRKLAEIETSLDELRGQSESLSAKSENAEARMLEAEVALTASTESIRNNENQLARVREQIGSREAATEFSRHRIRELEEEITRCRTSLVALSGRGDRLQEHLKDVIESLVSAESNHTEIANRVHSLESLVAELTAQLTKRRAEADEARSVHLQHNRTAATLASKLGGFEQQLKSMAADQSRFEDLIASLGEQLTKLAADWSDSQIAERRLDEQVCVQTHAAGEAEKELEEKRTLFQTCQDELSQLQEKLSGLRGRAAVLEELEARYDGLAAGVREILEQSRSDPHGELAGVRGVVAELLQANVEMAPLVDTALGESAQFLVLGDSKLLDSLRAGTFRPEGRVGVIAAHDSDWQPPVATIDIANLPGVIGRAVDFVETTAENRSLAWRLLDRTWFVETLDVAFRIRKSLSGPVRFVCRSGELLDTNGSVVVGQPQGIAGLVSRRSELRALKSQMVALAREAERVMKQLEAAQQEVYLCEDKARRLSHEARQLSASLSEQRIRTNSVREKFEQTDRERHVAEQKLADCRSQHEKSIDEHATIREQLTAIDEQVAKLAEVIRDREAACQQLESQRQEQFRLATSAKVDLATSEQDVRSLRLQRTRFEDDQRERSRSLAETQERLHVSVRRRFQTEEEILSTSSDLAEAYAIKDQLFTDIAAEASRRELLVSQKAQSSEEAQSLRKSTQGLADRMHQLELAAGELRLNRKTLADRLREDYAIELDSQAAGTNSTEPLVREDVEQEIETLRRKLSSIGAVNLEALNELDELEARFNTLSGQYNDLASAKETLERIINKINTDSRRLFMETLEAIRTNFQNLYRRAFGGGKADIVMEEGVDVLEAGVEILAQPPGKPSFNNSLLSGGEKALTAVALLMAIFEYRPSPFCVLDEVDAPFDEANIGRFVDVLKGFLDRTRFVIVTHSKKTMTSATTLYGVTMQESGVSKRVSVKFDDVSDDGRISKEAIDRDEKSNGERGAA